MQVVMLCAVTKPTNMKINPTFYSRGRRTILEKIPKAGEEEENPANVQTNWAHIQASFEARSAGLDSTVTSPNPDRWADKKMRFAAVAFCQS
jgi:hypothetical protein